MGGLKMGQSNVTVQNQGRGDVIYTFGGDKSILSKPIVWCGRKWTYMVSPNSANHKLRDVVIKTAAFIPLVIATIASSILSFAGNIIGLFKRSSASMVKGSGKIAEKRIDYLGSNPPKILQMKNPGELYITKGESNSVIITADENLLDILSPVVEGDKITFQSRSSYSTNNKITYRMTVTSLPDNIELSGSGTINIDTLKTPTFNCKISGNGSMFIKNCEVDKHEVTMSGSGHYNVSNIQAKDSNVVISGSGDMVLNGGVIGQQQVSLTGSTNYDARNVKSKDANVNAMGSGDVKVQMDGNLSVKISGSAVCTYSGNPATISKNITGSGSLERG
jgi:hypothetical protein